MIEIIIIEDDPLLRAGLAQVLQGEPGFRSQHTFADCESALLQLEEILPDVVLLDLELGECMPGIAGAARIKQILPDVDTLILTIHDEDQYAFAALRSGATGYPLKSSSPEEIIAAIPEAQNGGAPMSTQIAQMVARSFNDRPHLPKLTERQQEILHHLCEGKKLPDHRSGTLYYQICRKIPHQAHLLNPACSHQSRSHANGDGEAGDPASSFCCKISLTHLYH